MEFIDEVHDEVRFAGAGAGDDETHKGDLNTMIIEIGIRVRA